MDNQKPGQIRFLILPTKKTSITIFLNTGKNQDSTCILLAEKKTILVD